MDDTELMVSIRCATYNHEPYIRQCLDGFVMQKTNFRFEAIVHDDASTDGTAAIVREYAEKYPDFIKPIYETENQYSKHDGSLSRIMNAHTRGKYVAMCEGDDYWTDPLKLQKQVDFLEGHPEYGLVRTNVNQYIQKDDVFIDNYFSRRLIEDTYSNYIMYAPWEAPCTWLYRTSYLSDVMDFKVKNCFKGDLLYLLLISKSSKVAYLKDTTAVYRVLPNSASHFDSYKECLNFWRSVYRLRAHFAKEQDIRFRCKFYFKNLLYYIYLLMKAYLLGR